MWTTTVDVVFKLGQGTRQEPAYPVQKISMDNFTWAEAAILSLRYPQSFGCGSSLASRRTRAVWSWAEHGRTGKGGKRVARLSQDRGVAR